MDEFEKLGLDRNLTDILESLGFKYPTEIQKKTIPLILEGRDIIGNAATGSGKTLAFSSGIIKKAIPGKGIQALILVPTRELAEQTGKVLKNFCKKTNLKIQEVFGGVSFDRQTEGSKKAEIIVGTPGRILDHLEKRTLDFFNLKILVLDEADRMVDMGFFPDIKRIIGNCPIKRQTLLFSATTSSDVEHISKKYMKNPLHISTEKYVDATKLKQVYYSIPPHLKFSLFAHLIKKESSGIILVFCNTRKNVDMLSENLKRYKIFSLAIHGGFEQKKRSRTIQKVHENKSQILICTDVAARGLDIKGVTHVYNYDIPRTSEEYIHRIGRTARIGETGMAISIVTNRDYENFRRILLDESLKIEEKQNPEFKKLTPRFQTSNKPNKKFNNRTHRNNYSKNRKRTNYKKSFRKNIHHKRPFKKSRNPKQRRKP